MSHDATNWALDVRMGRGLSPGEKWLLWHLCDHYNPEFGCFPKQTTLAAECEVSVATINRAAANLETAGLIHRVKSKREKSGQQENTQYILAFEDDFPGDKIPILKMRSGPSRTLRGGRAQVTENQGEPDSQNEKRPDSQIDQIPSLILRVIKPCNSNPVNASATLSIIDNLQREFPASLAAIGSLDAQEADDYLRVIVPNEYLLDDIKRAGIDKRVKALIADTGERRPVLFGIGSNSKAAPLPNHDPVRTVA